MSYAIHETTLRTTGESASGIDASGKRTWIVIYDATTPPANLVAVESITELPVPFVSTLLGDSRRICRKNTARPAVQGGDGLIFIVETEYEIGEGADSPLGIPDKIVEFAGAKVSKTIFMSEVDGSDASVPIVTTAGEPFEKLAEQTTSDFKLTIEGNREDLDTALIISFLRPNARNDDSFTVRGITIGAGEAKMVNISATPQTENGVDFWKYRWEMEIAPDWDLHIEDRGFHEKDAVAGKLKEIVKGTPATKVETPWPLDGAGAAKPNADDVPEQLTFHVQPRQDFSAWEWTATA